MVPAAVPNWSASFWLYKFFGRLTGAGQSTLFVRTCSEIWHHKHNPEHSFQKKHNFTTWVSYLLQLQDINACKIIQKSKGKTRRFQLHQHQRHSFQGFYRHSARWLVWQCAQLPGSWWNLQLWYLRYTKQKLILILPWKGKNQLLIELGKVKLFVPQWSWSYINLAAEKPNKCQPNNMTTRLFVVDRKLCPRKSVMCRLLPRFFRLLWPCHSIGLGKMLKLLASGVSFNQEYLWLWFSRTYPDHMAWHTGSWELSISEPHLVTVAEPLGFMAKPSALVAPQKKIVFKPRWAHGRSDQPTAWGVCFFFADLNPWSWIPGLPNKEHSQNCRVHHPTKKWNNFPPCHQHVLQQSLSINTHTHTHTVFSAFCWGRCDGHFLYTSVLHVPIPNMNDTQLRLRTTPSWAGRVQISNFYAQPSPIPPLQPGSAGWRGHHAQPLLGQEIFSTSCWKHLWRNWWVFSCIYNVRLSAYEPHELHIPSRERVHIPPGEKEKNPRLKKCQTNGRGICNRSQEGKYWCLQRLWHMGNPQPASHHWPNDHAARLGGGATVAASPVSSGGGEGADCPRNLGGDSGSRVENV